CALIECGPGQTLSQLARQCTANDTHREIAHSIEEGADELESFAIAIARAWLAGVPLDLRAIHSNETRRRLSLPGYPFERQRYFADLPPGVPMPLATAATDGESPFDANATIPESARAPRADSGASTERVFHGETESEDAQEKV